MRWVPTQTAYEVDFAPLSLFNTQQLLFVIVSRDDNNRLYEAPDYCEGSGEFGRHQLIGLQPGKEYRIMVDGNFDASELSYQLRFLDYCSFDTIRLSTQADVDNFVSNAMCPQNIGTLIIGSENPPYTSDITSLNGLLSIRNIANDLIVSGNPLLGSLDGLNASLRVGGRTIIRHNALLSTLNALNNLNIRVGSERYAAPIVIHDNPLLAECDIESVCFTFLFDNSLEVVAYNNAPGCSSSMEIEQACFGGQLPVTYTSFTAIPVAKQVLLRWKTESERNNAGFTVERSADGMSFADLAFVAGEGGASDYQYTDAAPLAGRNFYRLRQRDYDGNETYSSVRVIDMNVDPEAAWTVYPNPAKDRLFIRGAGTPVAVELYTAEGRRLGQLADRAGYQLPPATPGLYVVRITGASGRVSYHRVVINSP